MNKTSIIQPRTPNRVMPAKAGIDRPKTQVLQSYDITSADRDADKTASALGTECRRNASAVIQRPRIHILVSDNLEKARKIGIASIVARKDAPVHPRLFEANFKALPGRAKQTVKSSGLV